MEYPLRLRVPAVTPFEPLHDRIVIGLRRLRIAEYAVLDPPPQRFDDGRRRTEIHVGHPHGQYVGIAVQLPFDRVRPAARDYFVEIVFHRRMFFVVI